MNSLLEALRASGNLRAIDLHLALSMERTCPSSSPEVLAAAALCSAELSLGHVCISVERVESMLKIRNLAGSLRKSDLVSNGSILTPLVFDGERLYLRRYWQHEGRVAEVLLERSREGQRVFGKALAMSLARHFPEAGADDLQCVAAALAPSRRLSLISGGPGTGKTFTVLKLLACLIEQYIAGGDNLPKVLLVAPTGKAAARLVESLSQGIERASLLPEVAASIPKHAQTIHRALGLGSNSNTRVKFHRKHPLLADIVLVDEASMVDLALMARLLDAVPPRARLLLLGDRNQLASVDAGGVFADICRAAETLGPAPNRRAYVRALLEGTDTEAPPGGIGDSLTELVKSYRYAPTSGVAQVADAIREGQVETALAALDSDEHDDVELFDIDPSGLPQGLLRLAEAGLVPLVQATSPEHALQSMARFQILCAHQHGPVSVHALNEAIAAHFQFGRPPSDSAAWLPIMVLRNDYGLGLFNGDIGVVRQGVGSQQAFFVTPEDSVRCFSTARLPEHQPVYAMTIHKSQGSEFDHVVVVLPDESSPLLSRELLYTAVTRAKKRVTIFGSKAAVRRCVATPTERRSGLLPRLVHSAAMEPANMDLYVKAKRRAAENDEVTALGKEGSPILESKIAPSIEPSDVERPQRVRPRRPKAPANQEAPLQRQLSLNLELPGATPERRTPPPRTLKRRVLPKDIASCCGHRGSALLRCPRCAHVWIECCICDERAL